MRLAICEIFRSLQGEAHEAGWPCVFVRLAGCNLRCSYCDSSYSWLLAEEVDLETITTQIKKFGDPKRVCLTGGEPLIQREATLNLAERLLSAGYRVSLETNGTLPLGELPKELVAIIDIKTPASGMSGVINFENLRQARRHHDYFKFVIAHETDLEWAFKLIKEYRLASRYRVLFSPVLDQVKPAVIAQAILDSGLEIGLNLQLQRLIWPDQDRGR